jgi:hypothetical protein
LNQSNQLCKAHSGFEARIVNAEKQIEAQWGEISAIKKFIMWILGSSLLSLIGIIAILVDRMVIK